MGVASTMTELFCGSSLHLHSYCATP